jgi:UrcA family protein
MSQFNSTLRSRRCGTLYRRAILLGMLAFPCSLQAMMNSNTAALASRAGSGPESPVAVCVALVAVATNSAAPAHGECYTPAFSALNGHCVARHPLLPSMRCRRRRSESEMQQMKNTPHGRQPARAIQLVTAIAVGVAAMATVPAHAHVDESAPRTLRVNVQDLDLGTPRGQDALRRRIKWAADIVCGSPDTRDLRVLSEYRSCVSETTNGALAQIKFPNS